MKMRIETRKPINLNDQLNAISKGLLSEPYIGTAASKRSGKFKEGRKPTPVEFVTMFPTPVAADADTGSIIGKDDVYYMTKNNTPRKINKTGTDGSVGLARYAKFFPTPQNRDYKSGQAERINREGKQKNLNDFVQMWPTPRNNSGPSKDDKHLSLDGAVRIWPTPRAGNPGSRPNKKGGKILAEEVKKSVCPTPTSYGNYNHKGASENSGDGLETAVKKFPTPTVQDYKHRGPNSNQQGLADIVRLWATPTANDAKNSLTDSQAGRGTLTAHIVETEDVNGGQLNADWVEILMGYPLYWTDTNKDPLYGIDLPAAWLDGTWEEGIPRVITCQKNRVKRLKGLGNAVVPQIPELIFRRILEAENENDS